MFKQNSFSMKSNLLTFLLLFCFYQGISQMIRVKDINVSEDMLKSANPSGLIELNNVLYFAGTSEKGSELWKMKDATPEVVKDINVGPAGSDPSHFVKTDNQIFFVAEDGV